MKPSYSINEFDQLFPDQGAINAPVIPAAQQDNEYGAWFRATGEESGVSAGAKAAGNLLPSAWNFGKGIVSMVAHPIQTAKGVGGAITDVGRTITNKLTDVTGLGQRQETPTLSAITDVLANRYGSLENAQRTAIEDPFGVGMDIAGILSGGAAVAGKSTQLANVGSKVSKVATAPVRATTSGIGKAVSGTAKYAASQATGLSPSTIETITKNTKAFSDAQKAGSTRLDLAENVFQAADKAASELSDLGKVYDDIRTSGATTNLQGNWLSRSLDKYGLKMQDGSVTADRTSKTRNVTDINKIQEFVDNWGDARNLTAEEYLNMRHDLAELAKYDQSGKSTVVRQFAQDVREGVLNSDKVRGNITGLKELDSKYAADVTFYNKIKKDFYNADGTIKDGAASKIVNAVNASNPERLARIEKLYPGFTEQAKVIKAVEDVENAYGLKVGTYIRGGAAVGGVMTGNLPVIVGAIISSPEIAVPLLKGYGYTSQQVGQILQVVRQFGSDINNFRTPEALQTFIDRYNEMTPAERQGGYALNKPNYVGKAKSATAKTTDLLEEARKYPDAESFIEAQGTPVYHGTNANITEFNLDNLGKTQGFDESGVFFTSDKARSKTFNPDYVAKPRYKMTEAERTANENLNTVEAFIQPQKTADITELESLYKNGVIKTKLNTSGLSTPETFFDNNRQAIKEIAEKTDIQVIKYTSEGETQYLVLDPSIIKTRTQLEDIWKQANEK